MKKFFSLCFVVLSVLVFSQDKIISFNQLPKLGQNFITSNFNKKNVSVILMDNDYFSKDFEIIFQNGTKIEQDSKGNWEEVDGKRNEIPTSFFPKSITSYVKKSFPNSKIHKIEKKINKYEVELSNGLDLEFDSKGNFIRIDD